MKRAVGEMRIEGIKTNLPLHRLSLEDSLFLSGQYCTDFIEKQQMVKKVREQERTIK
jgi:pyruvate carboxylase